MEAKELRIGNYIDKYGKLIRVDLGILQKITNGSVVYKPIELTEEWLCKFGFKQHEMTNFYYLEICNDWTRIYFDPYHNICELSISGHSAVLNQVIYVHQIQNLYFALKTEELTINEDNE